MEHATPCEAWTIGKGERRRLEAFEMQCYRKLKVSQVHGEK